MGSSIPSTLLGGQQYEALHVRIAEWEAENGARVEIISKKNHFELGRGFKSVLAAGTLGREVQAKMLNPRPVAPGERLRFQMDLTRVHLFDAETQQSLR